MLVYYKFKSHTDHNAVTCDGSNISVADLKKSIMQQYKLRTCSDFELLIMNAQTNEAYDNDDMLVPKNTSVIVVRSPVQKGTKKNWGKTDLPLPIHDDMGHIRYDRIIKNADLVNANTSEKDKVKAMIIQSTQEYDPSKYVKSCRTTGSFHPGYICHRCFQQGHWIENCPSNNKVVKRSRGIPRSFMIPVDGPEHKGALVTSSGGYAVPLIDHQAYKEVKKEKPPFVPQDEPVPEELLCMVCKDLLQDTVTIPCCANNFCDECVRHVLVESENHECPVCHQINVSPDTLLPNRFYRKAVLDYKKTGCTTRIRKTAAFVKSPPTQNVDSPQLSPDSTAELSHGTDNSATQFDHSPKQIKKESTDFEIAVKKEDDENFSSSGNHTPENMTPKCVIEDCDAQPGTPLADEPQNDGISQNFPIQTIGQNQYNTDRHDYHSSSKYSSNPRDDSLRLIIQRFSLYNDKSDSERDDSHSRYKKRHITDRGSHRTSHYDKSSRDSGYTSSCAITFTVLYFHNEQAVAYTQGGGGNRLKEKELACSAFIYIPSVKEED